MRGLLQDLRAAIERRTRAWIRRRQGADLDPVELNRQRIYILPTRLGVAYGAMLFAMLVGGMNYNNNLGLGLAFLLVSLGLVTMHHCHGTLTGVRLRLLEAVPGFAGSEVRFRLLLEHSAAVARPTIELGLDRQGTVVVGLAPLGTASAMLSVPAARRGRVALERFVVSTSHPFGLFRAWAVVHPAYAAIAWPRPMARGATPPLTATDTGGAQSGASGENDFAGLRPYQAGDSPRRIAWKAFARGRGLHTKQYAGTDVVSHVLDFDQLPGLDTESRLEQLCRWVLEAHERGEAFALRLPGLIIETNLGPAHRERCLNSLALFQGGEPRRG